MTDEMIERLTPQEWLELNAKLQKKKNILRTMLKEKGVLKKGATNTFDRYTYFSEAQYQELFTGLFADCGLELKFNEISYDTFTGSEKQSNGRMPKLEFELMDVETGFGETTVITGEGIDKGDKAGYKAYTGALKYYLANTFMVATGDDAEKESPSETMNTKVERKPKVDSFVQVHDERKATPIQVKKLKEIYSPENLEKYLKANNVTKVEDIPMEKASETIEIYNKQKGGK